MSCSDSRSGSTLTVSDVALTGYFDTSVTAWQLVLVTKSETLWSAILSRIFCPNFAAYQHSLIYVQQYQYEEKAEWQSLPQIDSRYPGIRWSYLSCVCFFAVELHYSLCFVLVTFLTDLNCWSSSLILMHTGINRNQVTWCPHVSTPLPPYVVELLGIRQVITLHKPGGTHK